LRIFDRLDNYLYDYEYKMIYKKNYLNIINYIEVIDFSDKEIKIKHSNGVVTIKGDNLVISKMFEGEAIILGNIREIEL